MRTTRIVLASTAVLLLGALPLVAAHGDEPMDMGADHPAAPAEDAEFPPSYFRHPGYRGWMYAHIALMTFGWFFVMPVAIMLSIARSRFHLPAQVGFHTLNGLGVFCSFVYNHATPDLYVNNAHHPIGWVVSSFTVVWTLLSVCSAFNDYRKHTKGKSTSAATQSPSTSQYQRMQQYVDSPASYRFSDDSGNFSAPGSRANSSESIFHKPAPSPLSPDQDEEHGLGDDDHDDDAEKRGFLGNKKVERFLSRNMGRFFGAKTMAALRVSQIVLEKFLLLLGFLAITSGFIVDGGIFRERAIFSGLAHYIKGGIFFWYGLLTLGRWMGAFTEFGWAWNIRPRYSSVSRWKAMIPSAEFTESFVIWLYGSSNVFLEHLNNWGGEWSPQDFEHVSITILFFGGGLLGMLIESSWLRNLANTTVEVQKSKDNRAAEADTSRFVAASEAAEEPNQQWEQPNTYDVPLNPMPALTIMLLGMMMSGHHQTSMVSTMMHAQWGQLFSGFAIARIITYITLWLKPPTSHFASRPPTELLAAFCLISGGIMFMNSSSDSVMSIESNGLDAMTIFTICMGLTGVIMAWEIICFAIKGWAVRKERAAAGAAL